MRERAGILGQDEDGQSYLSYCFTKEISNLETVDTLLFIFKSEFILSPPALKEILSLRILFNLSLPNQKDFIASCTTSSLIYLLEL